ncbi:MAG: hypothetical protein JXQ72_05965 [Anaerolineae bacterium]|nr:hypothetical protein [Anaerolineae bacterium]
MDLLEMLLGRDKKNRDDGIAGLVGSMSRWILTCGCMIGLAVIGFIAMIAGGIVSVGGDAMTVLIVLATIVVAVISLIRTSLGY